MLSGNLPGMLPDISIPTFRWHVLVSWSAHTNWEFSKVPTDTWSSRWCSSPSVARDLEEPTQRPRFALNCALREAKERSQDRSKRSEKEKEEKEMEEKEMEEAVENIKSPDPHLAGEK